ncbi:uncharacterized protein KAFR_0F00100, partial [Kazachstania africana CBS 2517]
MDPMRKRDSTFIVISSLAVFTIAIASVRCAFVTMGKIVLQTSMTKLADKFGTRREATWAVAAGGATNILDLVKHCTTASGQPVDGVECASSVLTSVVAFGFAVAKRLDTGAWWKRDLSWATMSDDLVMHINSMANQTGLIDLTLTPAGLALLGPSVADLANNVGMTSDIPMTKRDLGDEWLLEGTIVHTSGNQTIYNFLQTNFTHAYITSMPESGFQKRNGFNGYTNTEGHEIFVQSESEGTVAY